MSVKLSSTVSRSLTKITKWQKEPTGLSGETRENRFFVRVYNDSIIRVCITDQSDFENFSYSVVAEPVETEFTIEESPDEIRLLTQRTILHIRKRELRFRFTKTSGEVISEDDEKLGTSWNATQVTTYKKLQDGERFVGLGEKTGALDRRGAGYTNWNTDNFGYGSGADPLYSSIPFFIGIHHNICYGIFFDNTYKSFFNFGASNNRFSSFGADAGEMNYYFIYGDSVADIIQHYTHLTGRMELPPKWSIGYQQCRYSYYPEKEVLNVAQTFRDKNIPCDVIVLDIHYMEKYKIFTWSQKDFPDPRRLLQNLKKLGFEIVLMCDPGIKVEEGYSTYEDGVKNDVFIKYPDGTNYTGQVWPGWCHFPDFTNPKTRSWWKDQFRDYVNLGVRGFWNDMNEIATWGNMLPENIEMDFEGNGSSMRRGRNIYGFQMARSTYEGTKELMKNQRPFNLTRSGFSGVQRYSAVWTGDNVAYDEHMMLGVRIVNSMGLSGIAFAGYDVGGFVGNADSKLFARWVSIGAFSPFFRGHSMINSRDSEPWSYGEETEQISRNYIRFRYQLLPYIYSLFREASQSGMPLQRSLAIDYPFVSAVYDSHYHHQYMFGPAILVAPVESSKDFVKVLLPGNESWYSVYDGRKYSGNTEQIFECPLHRLPVFVKGGSIIPMQNASDHVGIKQDTLILHIYSGAAKSSFRFYEDDGNSFNYQSDDFSERVIEYEPSQNKIVLKKCSGKYRSEYKIIRLVLHGFSRLKSISIDGRNVELIPEQNSFFAGLEKFDPIKDPEPAPEEPVLVTEFSYSENEIMIGL